MGFSLSKMGHLDKEERNENQPKPQNQLLGPCEPLDKVLQNQIKVVSKQCLGHLEIRNVAFLGPTLSKLCAYRGLRFLLREGRVVLTSSQR